jgi:O-antigen/teichoic acid export membrane protein
VVFAIPTALLVFLGADLWVRLAFGEAFVPAASSLRVLGIQAGVTYATMLMAMTLVALGRVWTVTYSSSLAVVVRPALVVALVPPCSRLFGLGGAGAGAALAVTLTELGVLSFMLHAVGWRALGERTIRLAGRGALVALFVGMLHVALAPIGPWRLLVDMTVYLALGLLFGALPLRELAAFAREAIAARRDRGSPSEPGAVG